MVLTKDNLQNLEQDELEIDKNTQDWMKENLNIDVAVTNYKRKVNNSF